VRLTNCQAADSEPGKSSSSSCRALSQPQVRKRRALHDAELPLRGFSILLRLLQKILPRALSPIGGAL